jgi:hypothetical protein
MVLANARSQCGWADVQTDSAISPLTEITCRGQHLEMHTPARLADWTVNIEGTFPDSPANLMAAQRRGISVIRVSIAAQPTMMFLRARAAGRWRMWRLFEMTIFRKKPVIVQAFKYESGEIDNRLSPEICSGKIRQCEDGTLLIDTLEGTMIAFPGDWIIRGVKGEIYPCKPDIFAQTYDMVEDD